eukprot:TRINITY_DN75925_c0_g1_i1.p1 TRINITY_DN75925_c0_g1~~TRINITY_DN75925_c0_g1_i1.p1  ORF type:complete len:675 (-),score=222.15 TRINITY_DN75925_c0_g1_i1:7-2031(-)
MSFTTMKGFCMTAVLVSAAALGLAEVHEVTAGKPMEQIVKLLKDMRDKAKADAKAELETFEKFECYCKDTIKERTAEVESLTDLVASTKIAIEKSIALKSQLESKQEGLEKDIEEKKDSQTKAVASREAERNEYLKHEGEMNKTIEDLGTAISQLEGAGYNASETALLGVRTTIETASEAMSNSFLAPKALMQLRGKRSPSEVLLVLKSTLNTYISNRDELQKHETDAKAASEKVLALMKRQEEEMTGMLMSTQEVYGTTTEEIAEKTKSLENTQKSLSDTEAIKASTEKTCAEKKKVIENTKVLRAQEEAAIAQAIFVLTSDPAFATFSKIADSAVALVSKTQVVHQHDVRKQFLHKAAGLLRKLAHESHSSRLARVAAFAYSNPFEQVLEEISKMKGRIEDEAAADEKQFGFCKKEQDESNISAEDKAGTVLALESSLLELKGNLDNPSDGLKVALSKADVDLKQNQEDQAKETEMRKAENADYQKSIADLQQAQSLLQKGVAALKKYYDSIAADVALTQVSKKSFKKDDPAAEIGDGEYSGQSEAGGKVLSMLDEVLTHTKTEETAAHDAESAAQASFEDSMKTLVEAEASLKTAIADTNKHIADTNVEIDTKKDQLEAAKKEEASLEAYLKTLGAQCTFINTNFELRKAARVKETAGLEKAKNLITEVSK